MTTVQAHEALVMLGVELLLVFALATVADASPGWGPPIVMVMVLLWGVFLLKHAQDLVNLLGGGQAAIPAGSGGSFVP